MTLITYYYAILLSFYWDMFCRAFVTCCLQCFDAVGWASGSLEGHLACKKYGRMVEVGTG